MVSLAAAAILGIAVGVLVADDTVAPPLNAGPPTGCVEAAEAAIDAQAALERATLRLSVACRDDSTPATNPVWQ